MAMLKFNKGLLDSLKTKAISEGNVYITTDEHAMYVDVDNSTRIRIGQIVEKTSEEWENLAQPYDSSTYYYITNLNALVRWNGTKWVQINGTADIKADIADLKGRMTTAEGNIGTLTSDVSTLKSTVEGIVSVGGEKNKIEKITAGGAEVTIDANRVAKLGKFAAEAKTTIAEADLEAALQTKLTTMNTNIGANANAIGVLNGEETADGSVKKIAKGYADAAQSAAEAKATEAKNAAKAAQDDADALEGIVGAGISNTTLTQELLDLKGTVTTQGTNIGTLQTDLDTAEGKIATAENDISKLKTDVAAAQGQADKGVADAAAAASAAKTAQDAADANAGEIATLKTNVGNNATEIANVKRDYETKANVTAIKNDLQGKIDAIEEAIGTAGDGEDSLVTRVTANENAIDAINTKIGTVADGTTLAGSIKTVSDNLATLTEQVGNVTNIMNFRGVFDSTDKVTNPKVGDVAIVGNKEYVYAEDNQWHEYGDATGNASAITTLSGRVTTVENDLNTAETGLKARMTAVETKANNNATNIGNLDTTVKAMYTNAQIDTMLAWGTF